MFKHGFRLAAALILMPPAGFAQTAAQTPGADMAAPSGQSAEAAAQDVWLTTLQTQTPQQGFDLAVTLARRAVKTTQPDTDVLKAQRPVYAADANSLIDVSAAAVAWFATVAAANDYWRE